MKNKSNKKKSTGRQIMSGCIYVALSAVVVAVSVNTAISLLPDTKPLTDTENIVENPGLPLPKAEVIPSLPEISLPDAYDYTKSIPEEREDDSDKPVSDSVTGIDAVTVEETADNSSADSFENSLSDSLDGVPEPMPLSIPDGADLGFSGYIKPFDGFVTVSHSVDVPVYSPTMFDYRTHTGVDIAGEAGESIKAVSGGIITEIYNDDLLGHTVCVKNGEGYIIKYSNLMPTLADGIEVGSVIETGKIIGGIGETAISESAEASHLHLEIYDQNGTAVNPEDLIDF